MHLVQILLPLHDNQGKAFARDVFVAIRDELTKRFGGLTAYSRAPAEGIWRPATEATNKDEIVVYEVMVSHLDRTWWSDYRKSLELQLGQEQIVLRASDIDLL